MNVSINIKAFIDPYSYDEDVMNRIYLKHINALADELKANGFDVQNFDAKMEEWKSSRPT